MYNFTNKVLQDSRERERKERERKEKEAENERNRQKKKADEERERKRKDEVAKETWQALREMETQRQMDRERRFF